MNARGTFILSEKDAEKKDPQDLKYRQELMVRGPLQPFQPLIEKKKMRPLS